MSSVVGDNWRITQALTQENRVLNYKINLLAPFPKRKRRWVKETGGWFHERKKRRILGAKEVSKRDYIQVKCDNVVSFTIPIMSGE